MFMLETIRNSFAFRWRRFRTELKNMENREWMIMTLPFEQ